MQSGRKRGAGGTLGVGGHIGPLHVAGSRVLGDGIIGSGGEQSLFELRQTVVHEQVGGRYGAIHVQMAGPPWVVTQPWW